MSVFSQLAMLPNDPILGMTDRFNADTDPSKVNLGVGVYLDETGKIPLMRAVAAVEKDMAAAESPRGYLPMSGMPAFTSLVQELVFGKNSPALGVGRVATLQSLSGTGALRMGAGILALTSPDAKVLISDPSWENHETLFGRAGFQIGTYRYYAHESRSLDAEGMITDLSAASPGTIVILHACCHNPTGYDLSADQWDRVVSTCAERGLVPFIDMAYQGMSAGVARDALAVEKFVNSGMPFLVANSFSKTFGLYGERVGGISFVCEDADEAKRVMSQAKIVVRTLYSNPPTHGAKIVAAILGTPELRALWEQELDGMRMRLRQMRVALRSGLEAVGIPGDFSYITSQTGMFSYSGLSAIQMERLRQEFHVYGLDSGRLCMAGLTPSNVGWVVKAIASVITE